MSAPERPVSRVKEAKFFDSVGYSSVWEDERVIESGLRPQPGERVLSITSGGCFSLQFLLYDVAQVVSLDFSPHLTAGLEFKTAAARTLDHQALWEVLGLRPSNRRLSLYDVLREALSPESQSYWDRQKGAIKRGVGLVGKQDRYLHLVGRLIRGLQGRRRVAALLRDKPLAGQRQFYDGEWNTFAWRRLCDIVFSRRILDLAFDKEHFTYSKENHPALKFRQAVEHVLKEVEIGDNFYLHYLFFGSYPSADSCPAWLAKRAFSPLSERLDRIVPVTGDLEQFIFEQPDSSFDCFNFSNIFDWVSEADFSRLMGEVVRVARPGARLCYWTNLVNEKREIGRDGAPGIVEDLVLSEQISSRSRTPGYGGCVLARVVK
jgi:S-adenosylmethionine-diacylglycerol 3-amino-3-carboxypropyl transferase